MKKTGCSANLKFLNPVILIINYMGLVKKNRNIIFQ